LSLPPQCLTILTTCSYRADVSHHMQHDCRLSRASQIPITWPAGLSDFSCTAVHYKFLFPPYTPITATEATPQIAQIGRLFRYSRPW
jgi:hypothetical protein